MLDRSASGDNDLDLLIDRGSVRRFTEIVFRLGFKEARTSAKKQMPGVLDYYGYDEVADRWVHVHAHYQLVLGHDTTKNYRLPIEKPYLESAVQGDLFKVPAPEFEFIIFVIRMTLKHSTWDVILARQGHLSAAERQEFDHLQARVESSKITDILENHLPCLTVASFNACLQSLRTESPWWFRIKAGRQLKSSLGAHGRRPQTLDVWLKLWRRLVSAFQRRAFGNLPQKRLASGGFFVSIVGGDGSGKTTAIDALHAWLSEEFETIKVHIGKPPWSWTTIGVRGILKIGRSLRFYPFMKATVQYTFDTKSLVFPGYPWAFREVCTARDRYLAYAKVRRFATNGGLVITDRFPLLKVKLMDGPQIERMTSTQKPNRLIRFLVEREKRYYRLISLPELLIVLRTDPETAVKRKMDEDADSVRARSAEIWELNWAKTSAQVIDAGRSKEEVLADLKVILWSRL